MDNKIRAIADAILIIIFIAQGVYLRDKYNILSKKVDNLSKLISEMGGDVDYKTLKKLNLTDEDIAKIIKLINDGNKLEAIEYLNDLKNINHIEAYNIINKLIGGQDE
ncbi:MULTISPECIES: hypothetical protein [Anaerococcus]|uniref:Uncharacterized protein n=1 Tax=Anaerococcus octavius TaxID=54007 RepID=A0A2I1MBU7_9FIRM|nr:MULTISPECIES: hypothetical protein [Anaerococcus]MBS6105165.1 hypothetical protein [Anaerococcus sp.]PKZ17606.1 hypothetical protein CYJ34_02540 [Anaerococcus octavius]